MIESLCKLKPYPFEKGWEPTNRIIINCLLCIIASFCFGYVRYLEDIIYVHFGQISLPTLHSLFVCVMLTVIFLPYLIYKHGKVDFSYMVKKRSWIVLIYVSFEMLGYLPFTKARGVGDYLELSLCQGLLPIFLFGITYFVLKARYGITHYISMALSLICVALLVAGNQFAGRNNVNTSGNGANKDDNPIAKKALSIFYAIISPACYSIAYTVLEVSLRQFILEEILAIYGLYGIASNMFYTGLINFWENTKFEGGLAQSFALAVFLRGVGTIIIFVLAKTNNSVLVGLIYITIEFFYIAVASMINDPAWLFKIHILHFIGVGLGIAAVVLYCLKSVYYEKDVTEIVHFFKRPDIPYDDEPEHITTQDNDENDYTNSKSSTYNNNYINQNAPYENNYTNKDVSYQNSYDTLNSQTQKHNLMENSSSFIPPPVAYNTNKLNNRNDITPSSSYGYNQRAASPSFQTQSNNSRQFEGNKQGLNHRNVNQAAHQHLFGDN